MSFLARLSAAQSVTGSRLCVGLDPEPARLPAGLRAQAETDLPGAIESFCRSIIEATSEAACAYKPNLAFFESLGSSGWAVFERIVKAVPEDRLVIADAKRGDIGNTARHYAAAFFDRLPCDGVTISPYMGTDSVTPFLERPARCVFALVLTSNPGAGDFQLRLIDGQPLYMHVAEMLSTAASGKPGTLGFVVGGTRADRLAELRSRFPDTPFLVPGIGAQGGTATEVAGAAGAGPLLVNASRAILYASSGEDFADVAREQALGLREELGR